MILWAPAGADKDATRLCAWDPIYFAKRMAKAGLALPTELDRTKIPILTGMSAMWQNIKEPNPYAALIELIERHGTIRILLA